MDFAQINANLYVGSCPETLKDISVLKAIGITAVLNLQTAADERCQQIDWKPLVRPRPRSHDIPRVATTKPLNLTCHFACNSQCPV